MTREVETTDRSRLIDAGIPAGATVTHIDRARAWRSIDAREGQWAARRQRIRVRKRCREPFVYEHRALVFVPHKIVLGRSGGRVA